MPKFIPLLCLLLAIHSIAQEEPKYGFLNMIHAIPEGGICQISINGTKVNEAGFRPGDFTGGLLLKSGGHQISIAFPDKDPVQGEILIEEGKTSAYAIFNQVILDKQTKLPKHTIRITRLTPASPGGYHLEAVSLNETITQIHIADRVFDLKYLKCVPIDGWSGKPFAVSHGSQNLGSLAVEEKGTYVILVGKNSENKDGVFFFRHFEFELPEWYKNKKTEPNP